MNSQIKIEVLNQRKRSEDEFAEKVQQEKIMNKNSNVTSGLTSEKGRTSKEGQDTKMAKIDEPEDNSNNLFAGMMNVDSVLADKAKRKKDKEEKLRVMKLKRDQMQPLVIFHGVKDDPLPYEKHYIKT